MKTRGNIFLKNGLKMKNVNIIRLKITVNNPTSSDPHSGERGSRFFGVEAFIERKER